MSKLSKENTLKTLVSLLLSLTFLSLPSMVFAQETTTADESGPIVRRKLLYRSTRFEAAPHVMMTVNDTFRRNLAAGLALNYHLTNEVSLGGSFAFSLLHFNSDLSNNNESVLSDSDLNEITYSQNLFAADAGFYYAPIFGKFTLFKSTTTNYDIHVGAGFSIVNETAHAAADGVPDKTLEGIRPGGFVSLGARFFLSDMLSLNIDWKNRFYNRALISTGTSDADLSWVPEVAIGIGIFLPGTVKISR